MTTKTQAISQATIDSNREGATSTLVHAADTYTKAQDMALAALREAGPVLLAIDTDPKSYGFKTSTEVNSWVEATIGSHLPSRGSVRVFVSQARDFARLDAIDPSIGNRPDFRREALKVLAPVVKERDAAKKVAALVKGADADIAAAKKKKGAKVPTFAQAIDSRRAKGGTRKGAPKWLAAIVKKSEALSRRLAKPTTKYGVGDVEDVVALLHDVIDHADATRLNTSATDPIGGWTLARIDVLKKEARALTDFASNAEVAYREHKARLSGEKKKSA